MKRRKARERRARQTQMAQQQAAKKKLTPRQYMMKRVFGWGLVVLGVAVGVSHWGAHLGLLYTDTALYDLTIGYPTAGALGIAGAIWLSKTSV